MEVNLFAWIRESVKHAVMQGVSDAVGHIGSAGEHDDMPQRLTEALRNEAATVATATRTEIHAQAAPAGPLARSDRRRKAVRGRAAGMSEFAARKKSAPARSALKLAG